MVKCGVLFEVRTEFLKKHLDELRIQTVNDFSSHRKETHFYLTNINTD
jgi:hypothetical protein